MLSIVTYLSNTKICPNCDQKLDLRTGVCPSCQKYFSYEWASNQLIDIINELRHHTLELNELVIALYSIKDDFEEIENFFKYKY